jgi:hypothetical protein
VNGTAGPPVTWVTPIKQTEPLEVVPAIADRRSEQSPDGRNCAGYSHPDTVGWPRKRAFGRIAAR